MGAGSSARKMVKVEVKLREEAESKTQMLEHQMRQQQEELLETKKELERIRASIAGVRPVNAGSSVRWQPCRINKSLQSTWSLARVRDVKVYTYMHTFGWTDRGKKPIILAIPTYEYICINHSRDS